LSVVLFFNTVFTDPLLKLFSRHVMKLEEFQQMAFEWHPCPTCLYPGSAITATVTVPQYRWKHKIIYEWNWHQNISDCIYMFELSQHKILRLCIEASYKTRHASLSHVESPKRDQTRFSVLWTCFGCSEASLNCRECSLHCATNCVLLRAAACPKWVDSIYIFWC
jgi:hypothetical protein